MALTVRLNATQKKLVDKLKSKTGVHSASKALLIAAENEVNLYPKLKDELDSLRYAYLELKGNHRRLLSTIQEKIRIDDEIKSAIATDL